MLKKENFVPLAFFKKEIYTGSMGGMRYHVEKKEDKLIASVYPEPYCYEATPDQDKQSQDFPYTEEGREQIAEWINMKYEEEKELWDSKNIFQH